MKTTQLIFAFVIALLITTSDFAQSNENQLYYVSKATVRAERIEQYIELSKTWAEACKEHKYEYSFSAWQSNIYDFYWFYPVDDYNAVKDISAKGWEMVSKLDKGFAKEYFENIEFSEDFFIHFIDSLTYNPKTSVDGLVYAEWLIQYVKPWTGMKFRKAFKATTEVYQNKNFDFAVGTLRSDIGMNGGSSYIRVFWGKDVADLYTKQNKAWESLGEEVQQMIKDLTPLRRKFERIPFWYQKELSYIAE